MLSQMERSRLFPLVHNTSCRDHQMRLQRIQEQLDIPASSIPSFLVQTMSQRIYHS